MEENEIQSSQIRNQYDTRRESFGEIPKRLKAKSFP